MIVINNNRLNESIKNRHKQHLSEEIVDVEDKDVGAVTPVYADAVRQMKNVRSLIKKRIEESGMEKAAEEVVKENQPEAHRDITPGKTALGENKAEKATLSKIHLSEDIDLDDKQWKMGDERVIAPTEPQYKKLQVAVDAFNKNSDEEYVLRNVYLDYSADWMWTTVCKKNKPVQMLDSKDWLDIMNSNSDEEIEEIVKQALTRTYAVKEDVENTEQVEKTEEVPTVPNNNIAIPFSTVINDLLKEEYDAIDNYNSAIATARAAGQDDLVSIFEEIANDEHMHTGNLQKALELINPQSLSAEKGKVEAEEVIANAQDTNE